jgi:urea transporter
MSSTFWDITWHYILENIKEYIVYTGLQLGPEKLFTEYRISLNSGTVILSCFLNGISSIIFSSSSLHGIGS